MVNGVGRLGRVEAMEAGGREFEPRPGHYSRMSLNHRPPAHFLFDTVNIGHYYYYYYTGKTCSRHETALQKANALNIMSATRKQNVVVVVQCGWLSPWLPARHGGVVEGARVSVPAARPERALLQPTAPRLHRLGVFTLIWVDNTRGYSHTSAT